MSVACVLSLADKMHGQSDRLIKNERSSSTLFFQHVSKRKHVEGQSFLDYTIYELTRYENKQ